MQIVSFICQVYKFSELVDKEEKTVSNQVQYFPKNKRGTERLAQRLRFKLGVRINLISNCISCFIRKPLGSF